MKNRWKRVYLYGIHAKNLKLVALVILHGADEVHLISGGTDGGV